MNDRRPVLLAALGFLALEPSAPELQLLHRCFDSWRGIGDVVTGMARQGYRLHLTVSLLPFRPARVHGVRPALEVIVLPELRSANLLSRADLGVCHLPVPATTFCFGAEAQPWSPDISC